MKFYLYMLVFLLLGVDACKPPRCTIPTCYVRMKHRHGGENWKDAPPPPKDFELETGATNITEKKGKKNDDNEDNAGGNRGTEYRGVRWWVKNKNPKIGEGYKPGYKYDYKKPKHKSRKPKKERNEAPEGEEQLENGQNAAPDSISVQPEQKKGFFNKLRSRKSKKSEEPKPEEEEETQEEAPAKPNKQEPADKKDGF